MKENIRIVQNIDGFPFKSVRKSTDRILYGVAAAVIAGFHGVPALLAAIRVDTNMTHI